MEDNILLVDDDPSSIQLMGRILSGMGRLRFATCGEDALRLSRVLAPDLVLLDAEMPGLSGFEVCDALKSSPTLSEVPVIFVTSHCEAEFELAGFNRGAVDFIAKPVSPPLVQARVRTHLRLKRLGDDLRRLCSVDAVTGVANRRCFDEALEREWLRARRNRSALGLLMIDVDHFKLYNDHYGHPEGDACLKSVALTLQGACQRPGDLMARYGGEEFVLLLPDTDLAGAWHVAHDVLARIKARALPHAASPLSGCLSVSIGIGHVDEPLRTVARGEASDSRPASALVQAADSALYAAKRLGRAQAQAQPLASLAAAAGAILKAVHV